MTYIAIGLPGSGKTTFLKSCHGLYFDGDSYNSLEDLADDVNHKTAKNDVYIDGLFLTEKVREEFELYLYTSNITYLYWEPNREACLYNDSQRDRPLTSAVTIRNAVIEKPTRGKIITMPTKKYDGVTALLEHFQLTGLYGDDVYYSEEWSNGGTYGTCWDEDGPSEVSAGTPLDPIAIFDDYPSGQYLNEFKERTGFDLSTLTTTNPDIFYEKDCSESDYYGGHEYRERWEVKAYDLVAAYLSHHYNITDISHDEIREKLPELFI
jgi:hypothetical protein